MQLLQAITDLRHYSCYHFEFSLFHATGSLLIHYIRPPKAILLESASLYLPLLYPPFKSSSEVAMINDSLLAMLIQQSGYHNHV